MMLHTSTLEQTSKTKATAQKRRAMVFKFGRSIFTQQLPRSLHLW